MREERVKVKYIVFCAFLGPPTPRARESTAGRHGHGEILDWIYVILRGEGPWSGRGAKGALLPAWCQTIWPAGKLTS